MTAFMKYATTLDEQVEILKTRGLVINDEEKAKEVLLDIGYYRFGAYLFPFEKKYPSKKNRDHIYKDGRLHTVSKSHCPQKLRRK